jgi:DNA invertase Pin-like site-specific DNA recombinase
MTNHQANLTARRAVALYRVSTTKQGRSGLGLDAQRDAVHRFLNPGWELVDEIVEVASGRAGQREGLDKALSLCRAHNAVLLIARLCRLSRDPILLMELEKSGVEFVAVDMPFATQVTIRLMAVLAAEEARLVSERTKQALAARRERGLPLGGNNPNIRHHSEAAAASSSAVRIEKAKGRAKDMMPLIHTLRSEGNMTLGQIARGLNAKGVSTPRGSKWRPQSVSNLLRLQANLEG